MTNPNIVSPVKMEYGLNFSISGLNISEKSEIRPRMTLGRIWEHWADIWEIVQTLGRHWANIGQALSRNLADIWHLIKKLSQLKLKSSL